MIMKREVVFFRALLLVSVATLIGFGVLAIYYDREASSWGDLRAQLMNEKLQARIRCEKAIRDGVAEFANYSCNFSKNWKEAIENAENKSYFYGEKSSLFTTLALAVPLFCLFAFYGGRWAVSGRLKPLWPFRDSSQS